MKTHFLQRYFDPTGGAAGMVIGAANAVKAQQAGRIQSVLGLIQTVAAEKRAKRLLGMRQAYKTPEEYYDILNATASLANQGYDAATLGYLTSNIDRGFSSAAGTATRLGADPNQLSALFDQRMQGIMRVGAENARLNMENFSRYLGALDVIGQNKAAEQKSQQDLLKDDLQAASVEKQQGVQNIFGGINTSLGGSAAIGTSTLYSNVNSGAQYDVSSANAGGQVVDRIYRPNIVPGTSNLPIRSTPIGG